MAIREIVIYGDDVLNKKCRVVDKIDDRTKTLIGDMFETLYKSNGVGLAAPQVGVLKRIAVIDTDENPIVLINPEILSEEGEQTGTEGCLSIPGRSGQVERPKKIAVEAFNRNGDAVKYKVDGFAAVAFCHEIDHLDGIMYIDKMISEDFE